MHAKFFSRSQLLLSLTVSSFLFPFYQTCANTVEFDATSLGQGVQSAQLFIDDTTFKLRFVITILTKLDVGGAILGINAPTSTPLTGTAGSAIEALIEMQPLPVGFGRFSEISGETRRDLNDPHVFTPGFLAAAGGQAAAIQNFINALFANEAYVDMTITPELSHIQAFLIRVPDGAGTLQLFSLALIVIGSAAHLKRPSYTSSTLANL